MRAPPRETAHFQIAGKKKLRDPFQATQIWLEVLIVLSSFKSKSQKLIVREGGALYTVKNAVKKVVRTLQ